MTDVRRLLRKGLLSFVIAGLILAIAEMRPDPVLTMFLDVRPCQDFLVVAHRGANRYAPENTISAFRKALELGANAVECDILFTKDDVPIVCHDANISDKVPPEQRPVIVTEMNFKQVKDLDVGTWFSKEYQGEKIPSLREALQFLKGKVVRVYLHDKFEDDNYGSKAERAQIFAEEIRKQGMENHAVVMVESGDVSTWQKSAPDIQLLQCWVGPDYQSGRFKTEDSYRLGIKHFGIVIDMHQLNFWGKVLFKLGFPNLGYFIGFWPNKAVVEQWKARGVDFTVFFFDDPFLMKLYLHAGFNAIGTDAPDVLISVVNGCRP